MNKTVPVFEETYNLEVHRLIKHRTREVPRGTKFSGKRLSITSLQFHADQLKHSGKGHLLR